MRQKTEATKRSAEKDVRRVTRKQYGAEEKIRIVLDGLRGAGGLAKPVYAAEPAPGILVYKDPNCGCCADWIRHLRSAGFAVNVQESKVLHLVRRRLAVPDDLAACHKAQANGYVIEGHVPAVALRRLLEARKKRGGEHVK